MLFRDHGDTCCHVLYLEVFGKAGSDIRPNEANDGQRGHQELLGGDADGSFGIPIPDAVGCRFRHQGGHLHSMRLHGVGQPEIRLWDMALGHCAVLEYDQARPLNLHSQQLSVSCTQAKAADCKLVTKRLGDSDLLDTLACSPGAILKLSVRRRFSSSAGMPGYNNTSHGDQGHCCEGF